MRSMVEVTVTDTIAPAARDVITSGLHQFNVDQTGIDDWKPLGVLVADDAGQVLGGLAGRTTLGVLFIDVFFLPERLRGHGLGSRVLRAAENEARRRGCQTSLLVTTSFQAPTFYEQHGYQRFGEIACQPPGASRIFMRKPL
jgi:GNAT superfamily N-acetyltransferase